MGDILGVRRVGNSGTYLGLPSLVGINKKDILGFIKNRIVNRVQSWNYKFLSILDQEERSY